MDNANVRNLMIEIYKPNGFDWLDYKVTRHNPYTYHHIKAKRNRGKATIENGALLSKQAHQDFNILEQQYPELAKEVNFYFYTYKGNYPYETYERIQQIMGMVEHGKQKTKKV